MMKATPARVPVGFCDRLVTELESGRITAADLNTVGRGVITPAVLAVIQGE